MWRKFTEKLIAWKDDPDRKVLLLEGVRQCGKTYILREFGKEFFSNTVYVNFEKDPSAHSLFDGNLGPKRIIENLAIYLNTNIVPGKTLIILDEIQECERAMTSLKYFSEEAPEYHVACAGSLLGLMLGRGSFPVGRVDRYRLYPMTFYEFLMAEGEERLCGYLMERKPTEEISAALHQMASDHLRNYYIVGGMPKAVQSWVNEHNIPKITRIHSSLLKDYRDDFVKHGSHILPELTAIWDSLPGQLMKENSRMILKDVLPRGRAEVFKAPMQWLMNAGLIHCVYQSDSPQIPLNQAKKESIFKVYACDVGLLRTMSGTPPSFVLSADDEYRLIKGAMAENLMVCLIKASGYDDDICYWKEANNEVDILFSTPEGVIPAEVKFGFKSDGKSLKKYESGYSPVKSLFVSMNPPKDGYRMRVPMYAAESIIPFFSKNENGITAPSTDPSIPFTMRFGEDDWQEDGNGFSITIPKSRHNRKPSIVQTFIKEKDGSYRQITVDTRIGVDVILNSSSRFEGKVEII